MTTFLGIDLGTSNCALATAGPEGAPTLEPVTQVVTPHSIGELDLLPSAVYLPAEGEAGESTAVLPWAATLSTGLLGRQARERGALQPDRLILSAKSWLCHPHVDRRGPLLPWGSTVVTQKWSPLEVSRQLLTHLLASQRQRRPDQVFSAATTVVTVPASFDEAARSLTLEAAAQAGLGEITLLEEPQAAFYAWLEGQGTAWRSQVKAGDLLLVCDVGGGTADFSLIAVSEHQGDLALERVAVGEHLLLGGDNMDLALAHALGEALAAAGTPVDDTQFLALVHAARAGKEAMLGDASLTEVPISVPARGRRLVASTLRTTLTREQVNRVVLDGFFPRTAPTDLPVVRRAGGLREAGLPYAADAALSKHLARFLTRARANVESSPALLQAVGGPARLARASLLVPDAVLFNGGVFNSEALRHRVLELLSAWAGSPVRALAGARPDHAVALGAAAYARLRATGHGVRIKAGTARSCYIGMESATLAVPGRRATTKALCVAPQGMEEGTRHALLDQEFFLYTGETAEFRFFTSEARAGDRPGQLLPDASELEESARLEVNLPSPEGHAPGEEVPVRMEAVVTELGNLELYLVHVASAQRWKLELNVRMK
ncbi:MAG: Hsp70 family protein [Opitutaceae bacterium]|nr:Hsp70 family protein [Opitutaceae bacterium]